MFERSFAWSMRNGPWLILSVAAVMLLAGLVRFYRIMAFDRNAFGTPEFFFLISLAPATILLFGALVAAKLGRHADNDVGPG